MQQGYGLGAVSFAVTLTEGVGVVAAGPGQLGPVARLAAEGQRILKVTRCLVQVSRGLR